jgi:hypothetical protein
VALHLRPRNPLDVGQPLQQRSSVRDVDRLELAEIALVPYERACVAIRLELVPRVETPPDALALRPVEQMLDR